MENDFWEATSGEHFLESTFKQCTDIAVDRLFRTLGLKGVWNRCLQPRMEPLHPALTYEAMAILSR